MTNYITTDVKYDHRHFLFWVFFNVWRYCVSLREMIWFSKRYFFTSLFTSMSIYAYNWTVVQIVKRASSDQKVPGSIDPKVNMSEVSLRKTRNPNQSMSVWMVNAPYEQVAPWEVVTADSVWLQNMLGKSALSGQQWLEKRYIITGYLQLIKWALYRGIISEL